MVFKIQSIVIVTNNHKAKATYLNEVDEDSLCKLLYCGASGPLADISICQTGPVGNGAKPYLVCISLQRPIRLWPNNHLTIMCLEVEPINLNRKLIGWVVAVLNLMTTDY